MNLLNPLAEMYGPHFLALYAAASGVVCCFCWWWCRCREPDRRDSPFVPEQSDPYEIAFLRGGEPEVVRLAQLSLVQKGYLEIATKEEHTNRYLDFVETAFHPEPSELPEIERSVFQELAQNRSDLAKRTACLRSAVQSGCVDLASHLRQARLIPSAEQTTRAWTARILGSIGLGGLAVFKVSAALNRGHTNVAFLILMSAGAIALLWVMCKQPLQTARGRRFLNSLQSTLDSDKQLTNPSGPISPATLLLLFSVFGSGILKDSAYASVYGAFEAEQDAQRAANNAGGCGGGCGDGGGGGCGGCGGCGG